MKRAAVIFTVFVMVTLNLKVLAHAVTAPPAKTRFVLFCMTSKGSQASCSHKNCPLHDNSKHDTSKEDNLIYCETRIECGAAHNNETTVLSANDAIYIHSTQTLENYQPEICLNNKEYQVLKYSFSLRIDKPPKHTF